MGELRVELRTRPIPSNYVSLSWFSANFFISHPKTTLSSKAAQVPILTKTTQTELALMFIVNHMSFQMR